MIINAFPENKSVNLADLFYSNLLLVNMLSAAENIATKKNPDEQAVGAKRLLPFLGEGEGGWGFGSR
ncbi:MAG: hypothetical protein IJ222_10220 [Bacteroidales bacterium]|nr:hypothetical protein [Bacteroidales bacterium]